jgi:hypothetical protein
MVPVSKKQHKVFSLQEANKLVPELQKRLEQLHAQKEAYSRLHDTLFVHELIYTAERANGFHEEDDLEENIHTLEKAIERLAEDVEAIFAMGCVLRNIEKGQVDFPGMIGGEKIYWSWERGELSIQYYRRAGKGRGERLLIPENI